LTQERIDKLKQQMVNKKEEHDILQNRSEKDLWCQDLDDFVQEWETQLKEEADYQKTVRNTNRRVSRKIGAGKGIKSRKNDDDDFVVAASKSKPLKPNPAKGVVKVEHKPHQAFLDMFNRKSKHRPSSGLGSDGAEDSLSDEDFASLGAAKPVSAEASRSVSEQPVNGRSKRAAAAAPKKWVIDDEESEDDDSKYLGDVGDMVKGIGGGDAANGRVSLFAMSRPSTSHGDRPTSSNGLAKTKPKINKPFDLSDGDETNYEMLARSSPHKAAPAAKDTLDSFLSDDDDLAPVVIKTAPVKAAARAPSVAHTVKVPAKRGPKPKKALAKEPTPAPDPKPVALSPAAKAYAAKQNKMKAAANKDLFSEDEDNDIEMNDSPPPKPAAKATKVKAPIKRTVISDDDDDLEMHDAPAPKPKPAAKQTKAKAPAKRALSDDDDDLEMTHGSPPPKPVGRGRPARAAVSKAKAKPTYIISDDEEDDFDASAVVEEEQSEDDFEDSD
jgi:DNA topoisomerase-2